ncbi:hypothetical protein COT72_05060 [archaeon CG10_big_fil_rev_8_21_14_0_10_43_11]|nr:MAG: hypothetical protein COT72_05060 [archaeon CG10_big_fil_rev_8_21_14_0_10_43_11]
MTTLENAFEELYHSLETNDPYDRVIAFEHVKKAIHSTPRDMVSKSVLAIDLLELYIDAKKQNKSREEFKTNINTLESLDDTVTDYDGYLYERTYFFQNKMLEHLKTAQKLIQDANSEQLYDFIEDGYDTDFKKLGYLYELCTDFQRKELWRRNVAITKANNALYDYITAPKRNLGLLEDRVKRSVNRFFDTMNLVQDFIDAEIHDDLLQYPSVKRAIEHLGQSHVIHYGKKFRSLNSELSAAQKRKETKLEQILDNPALIPSNNGISILVRYKQDLNCLRNFENGIDVTSLFDFSKREKEELAAYERDFKKHTDKPLVFERVDPILSLLLHGSELMKESGVFFSSLPSDLKEELNLERGVVKEMLDYVHKEHKTKRLEAEIKGKHVSDVADAQYLTELCNTLRSKRGQFFAKQKQRRIHLKELFNDDLELIIGGKQKQDMTVWKNQYNKNYLDALYRFKEELEHGLVAAEKAAERALVYL